jgi:hypothetical protein
MFNYTNYIIKQNYPAAAALRAHKTRKAYKYCAGNFWQFFFRGRGERKKEWLALVP